MKEFLKKTHFFPSFIHNIILSCHFFLLCFLLLLFLHLQVSVRRSLSVSLLIWMANCINFILHDVIFENENVHYVKICIDEHSRTSVWCDVICRWMCTFVWICVYLGFKKKTCFFFLFLGHRKHIFILFQFCNSNCK